MTSHSDASDHMKFVERAQPHEWLRVADNLHEQAVSLYTSRGGFVRQEDGEGRVMGQWLTVNRSVFLLAGFALENALKAFLVLENPSWISNGRVARPLRSRVEQ